MSFLTAEQTANFIAKGNADLNTIKNGLDLLLSVPHLSRQMFAYPDNLKQAFDEKLENALYSIWSGTFNSMKRDGILAYNIKAIQDQFHTEINAENVQKVEALMANECDYSALLTEWLSVVGQEKFKCSMKVEADPNFKDRIDRRDLTADVLFIAGTLSGVDLDFKTVKDSVKYMSESRNYKEIPEIEATLTMAQNKNMTLKLPKHVVTLLNNALSVSKAA